MSQFEFKDLCIILHFFRFIQIFPEVFRYIQIYSDILGYFAIFPHILRFIEILLDLSGYIYLCWHKTRAKGNFVQWIMLYNSFFSFPLPDLPQQALLQPRLLAALHWWLWSRYPRKQNSRHGSIPKSDSGDGSAGIISPWSFWSFLVNFSFLPVEHPPTQGFRRPSYHVT